MIKRNKGLKIACSILFAAYLILMVKVILFKYLGFEDIIRGGYSQFRSLNLRPFDTILGFWRIAEENHQYLWAFSNVFGNMLLYIPFGYCLPLLSEKMRKVQRTCLAVFLSSFLLESLQYLLYLGSADIDDLILNTLGGTIGYLVWCGMMKLVRSQTWRYLITIIGAFCAFAGGFIIAREQFGSLLGLKTYIQKEEGRELLPERDPDIDGTIYEYQETTLLMYEGFIMGEEDVQIENAVQYEVKLNEDTQYYRLIREDRGNGSVDRYQNAEADEVCSGRPYVRAYVWTDEGDTAAYVVVDERFLDMLGSGEIGSGDPEDAEAGITESAAGNEEGTASETEGTSEENSGEYPESVELIGWVEAIGESSFTINIVTEMQLGDGLASTSTNVMQEIQTDELTTYTIKTVRAGRLEEAEKEAVREDLRVSSKGEGCRVEIQGEKNGEEILAKHVAITIVYN